MCQANVELILRKLLKIKGIYRYHLSLYERSTLMSYFSFCSFQMKKRKEWKCAVFIFIYLKLGEQCTEQNNCNWPNLGKTVIFWRNFYRGYWRYMFSFIVKRNHYADFYYFPHFKNAFKKVYIWNSRKTFHLNVSLYV